MSDGYADLAALFGAAPTGERDVLLPSGVRVRVRGLTRHELVTFGKQAAGDTLTIERLNLAATMLRPTMTADQVAEWQRTANAGELVPVIQAVRELSGLDEGAAKSDLPGDGEHRS